MDDNLYFAVFNHPRTINDFDVIIWECDLYISVVLDSYNSKLRGSLLIL